MGTNKVVFLGLTGVGKTSIASRLLKKGFIDKTNCTIGVAYNMLIIGDTKIDLWDTAGQERFLSLMPIYYRDADIIVLVYDVNDFKTIDRLHYYMEKINEIVKNDHIIIVIGNKIDRLNKHNGESFDKKIRKEFDKYPSVNNFISISAKTNENINVLEELIVSLCQTIIKKKKDVKKIHHDNLNKKRSNFCAC